MWSSKKLCSLAFAGALMAVSLCSLPAKTQQQAQGFALERLYTSAPGAGWIVMDTLDMHGGIGGAVELTPGYERDPLRVQAGAGGQSLAVVSSEVFIDYGLAGTYDRYRVYANFTMPASLTGNSGTVGDYTYTAPNISPGSDPDAVADIRLGFDARLLGNAQSPFRLGAGAQLFIPNDNRSDYDTDGTFRAMGRLLVAGDKGIFTYAGQAGVHIRPLNDSPIPGSPQGSEFLFGIAGGVKIPVGSAKQLVLGSEVYGASAFASFLQAAETDKEWLISTRFEGTGNRGRQGRVKLGVGRGINPQFGAPTWRLVVGMELFGWTK
jgi:hypothetical protein